MCTETFNTLLSHPINFFIDNKEPIKYATLGIGAGAATCSIVAAFTGASVGTAAFFGGIYVPMAYGIHKGSVLLTDATIPNIVRTVFPECDKAEIKALTDVSALLITYFATVLAVSFTLSFLGSTMTIVQSFSLAASVLKIGSVTFLLYKLKLLVESVQQRKNQMAAQAQATTNSTSNQVNESVL